MTVRSCLVAVVVDVVVVEAVAAVLIVVFSGCVEDDLTVNNVVFCWFF